MQAGTTAGIRQQSMVTMYSHFAPTIWHEKWGSLDWVGSGLVGWYAVRASDGEVRDWDIANLGVEVVIL